LPPATLRQKRAQETRQLLLDTAYRLFGTGGYGQTSVDAIIDAAGISKGAFYHHFDSKEGLFNALIELRVRDCAEQMAGAVRSSGSLRDAVEGLAQAGVQSLKTDPAWLRLYMEFWLQASRDPVARKVVARSMSQCRDLIAQMLRMGQATGLVRQDLDPDAAAAILNGVFDGVALQSEIDPRAVDLDKLIRPMADLMQRFIEQPGTEPIAPKRRKS
jgi:AcrR family transcriptional regulator